MVRGTGAVPTLQNNTCSKNMRHGIFFLSGAKGTAEQNTCSENGHFGIIAYGEGTQPTLVANRCSNNARTGMVFWDVDGGLADKNVCSSNGRHGIAVADGPSKPRILHNTCANNAGAGIYCPHFCNAVVANNYISDNAEIGSRQVRNLLYKRKYAELEQMAARLRTRKYRFIDGNWQLVDFYKSLAYSYGSKETFEDAISTRRLDEWIKQNPESSTPWIAKAEAYTYLAWRARTGNFAAEVLAQNWKGFREKLLLAKEALAKAENLKPKDPHLYSVYLSTAMGLNAPDLVSEHLFNMGVSIEPGYLPLYYARAIALLPRWGGQQGALKAFASKAVERFEPGEADALYTRIAHAVLLYAGPRSTKDHDFSYERIKRGYPSILKAYPKATGYLDGYCAFACLNKDKKLARDLFEQIGEDWSQACWDTAKCFSSYKAWAFMD